jgi:hypothetical protein
MDLCCCVFFVQYSYEIVGFCLQSLILGLLKFPISTDGRKLLQILNSPHHERVQNLKFALHPPPLKVCSVLGHSIVGFDD